MESNNIETKTLETKTLETKTANLPNSPGVYLMKNSSGKVIYVGKARELKKRVSSYFRDVEKKDPKTRHLIKSISDFDFIVTDNEVEALLTEGTLIKEYRPRYNVDLKDDKNYLCLRIDLDEDFPRFTFVRNIKRDGARYFGPYTDAKAIRQSLKWLSATFLLRQCTDHKFNNRSRPCIYYEINQCSGPCLNLITKEEYYKGVDEVVMFLSGRGDDLIKRLTAEMELLAEEMKFEEAALYRDRIASIKRIMETQKVVTKDLVDRDVIGIHREGLSIGFSILLVRGGRLMGSWYRLFKNVLDEDPEAVQSFIEQYYSGERYVPDEILLPVEVFDKELLLKWLRGKSEVEILVPKRGRLRALVTMAQKNAESSFVEWKKSSESRIEALEALRERLGLPVFPRRMECFDISNVKGTLSVGSMAVFTDGEPDRSQYRHYKIKGVPAANDYAMIEEVLARRIKRLDDENRPDLILIDGGKGHLNIAAEVLRDLKASDIPLAAIAKGEKGGETVGKGKSDRVFLIGRKNPIVIKGSSLALFLLMQIRDEAHRFAIEYHRKLRKKKGVRSALDEIEGVGEKRKKALLKHFQRIGDIKLATVEELSAVNGVSPAVAQSIHAYFKDKQGNGED
ncbi:MAG: excinuclease ABC subunit UvrC [Deltaproteobacteria bacterium]|uniref:UvrABC system protein C n=1 Tax=Candidatus Zymogenus saltonus TaxID=2844893 RepID=A0A9D8KD61_9DELT|nr:excinuclease ABC subunit UvrC [Candidatus Zymogenus saltonus]